MSQGVGGASGEPGAEPLAAMRAAQIAGRLADALQASEAVIVTAADPSAVVEAVMARAEALAQVGLAADAFGLLRSTRDKERAAGRPGGAAKLSMAESALHMAAGEMSAAKSALIEAANDFGAADDHADQIRAQLQLAVAYSMTSEPDDVRQILAGCLAAAQQLGDPAVLAEVRHQEGSFLAGTGADPVASFEDGLQMADRSADSGGPGPDARRPGIRPGRPGPQPVSGIDLPGREHGRRAHRSADGCQRTRGRR